MPRILKKILLTVFAILLMISFVTSASAQQSGWAIRISMVSTLETPDAMNLKVYFSIYDPKTDLAILDFNVKDAQMALPQTNFLAGVELKKPDVPIYIVMVLDASGSMSGAAEDLKKAAKLALNNTPDNSVFSVVQFNEDIKLIQDFTQNIPAVSFAIDQYRVANKGTCLYDATYSAVESLQKAPPGRRAIILFTDGRDENANGKTCSKHTYQELSEFAQTSQIPVNTIGLSYKEGGLNEVELRGIAASTGGYSAFAKQDDMGKAFENIMNGLKAQWMVEINAYPRQGTNQAVLTLNLKEVEGLGATFNIESNTEYPGPPSPVSARMAGLQFKPEDQSYNIQLSMTSPELAEYVKVEVWDVKGGSKVAEYQFKDLDQNNTFNILTDQLVVGRDYQLRMTAISKADQKRFAWAADSEGKKLTELVHSFVFDPTSNLPALQIQSVAQKDNDLILSIKTTNSQLIGGFDGWLVDENTNTQVPDSDFSSPAIASASGTVVVPLSKAKIPEGKYTAVVRVLGKNNQVYSTVQYPGIVYRPRFPNLLQMVYTALIAAPIILFSVVFIILVVVGFLMYQSSREKSLTGTPALQGRLGGGLGGGKRSAGPMIPVSDHEPIPLRDAPPALPHNAPPQRSPALQSPSAQPQARSSQQVPDHTMIPANSGLAQGATMIAASPVMRRAVLQVISTPGSAQIPLNQFPFVIGRVEGALVIPEANVSRQHARIDYLEANRVYTITDLNSSNGTRLNNTPLVPGQAGQLSSGALIGLGPNVTIRFDLI